MLKPERRTDCSFGNPSTCEFSRNWDRSRHKEHLKHAKPAIDASMPKTAFLTRKHSKDWEYQQRCKMEASYRNLQMMRAIGEILAKDPPEYSRSGPTTLNKEYRKKEISKISVENMNFVHRILQLKSEYSRERMDKDNLEHEKQLFRNSYSERKFLEKTFGQKAKKIHFVSSGYVKGNVNVSPDYVRSVKSTLSPTPSTYAPPLDEFDGENEPKPSSARLLSSRPCDSRDSPTLSSPERELQKDSKETYLDYNRSRQSLKNNKQPLSAVDETETKENKQLRNVINTIFTAPTNEIKSRTSAKSSTENINFTEHLKHHQFKLDKNASETSSALIEIAFTSDSKSSVKTRLSSKNKQLKTKKSSFTSPNPKHKQSIFESLKLEDKTLNTSLISDTLRNHTSEVKTDFKQAEMSSTLSRKRIIKRSNSAQSIRSLNQLSSTSNVSHKLLPPLREPHIEEVVIASQEESYRRSLIDAALSASRVGSAKESKRTTLTHSLICARSDSDLNGEERNTEKMIVSDSIVAANNNICLNDSYLHNRNLSDDTIEKNNEVLRTVSSNSMNNSSEIPNKTMNLTEEVDNSKKLNTEEKLPSGSDYEDDGDFEIFSDEEKQNDSSNEPKSYSPRITSSNKIIETEKKPSVETLLQSADDERLFHAGNSPIHLTTLEDEPMHSRNNNWKLTSSSSNTSIHLSSSASGVKMDKSKNTPVSLPRVAQLVHQRQLELLKSAENAEQEQKKKLERKKRILSDHSIEIAPRVASLKASKNKNDLKSSMKLTDSGYLNKSASNRSLLRDSKSKNASNSNSILQSVPNFPKVNAISSEESLKIPSLSIKKDHHQLKDLPMPDSNIHSIHEELTGGLSSVLLLDHSANMETHSLQIDKVHLPETTDGSDGEQLDFTNEVMMALPPRMFDCEQNLEYSSLKDDFLSIHSKAENFSESNAVTDDEFEQEDMLSSLSCKNSDLSV